MVTKQNDQWTLMKDEILTGILNSDLEESWDHGDTYEDEFQTTDWDPER